MVELRTTNDVGNRTLFGAQVTLSTNICAVRPSSTSKPFPQRALPVTDRCSVGATICHAVSGFRRMGTRRLGGVIEKADCLAGFGIPGPQRALTRGDQSTPSTASQTLISPPAAAGSGRRDNSASGRAVHRPGRAPRRRGGWPLCYRVCPPVPDLPARRVRHEH